MSEHVIVDLPSKWDLLIVIYTQMLELRLTCFSVVFHICICLVNVQNRLGIKYQRTNFWLSILLNLTLVLCAVHTMMELKMTGNCLATSRPILSFDKVAICQGMGDLYLWNVKCLFQRFVPPRALREGKRKKKSRWSFFFMCPHRIYVSWQIILSDVNLTFCPISDMYL